MRKPVTLFPSHICFTHRHSEMKRCFFFKNFFLFLLLFLEPIFANNTRYTHHKISGWQSTLVPECVPLLFHARSTLSSPAVWSKKWYRNSWLAGYKEEAGSGKRANLCPEAKKVEGGEESRAEYEKITHFARRFRKKTVGETQHTDRRRRNRQTRHTFTISDWGFVKGDTTDGQTPISFLASRISDLLGSQVDTLYTGTRLYGTVKARIRDRFEEKQLGVKCRLRWQTRMEWERIKVDEKGTRILAEVISRFKSFFFDPD